jgi:hypothetical protein
VECRGQSFRIMLACHEYRTTANALTNPFKLQCYDSGRQREMSGTGPAERHYVREVPEEATL